MIADFLARGNTVLSFNRRGGVCPPNSSTNVFVGAFGQANPAPTGIFIHLAFWL